MIRVLITGSDVQTEVALMRRLQRIAGLPADALVLGEEIEACQVMVVSETRAGGPALGRARAGQLLWRLDAGGRLFPPQTGAAPLGEVAIREALQALYQAASPDAGAASGSAPFAEQLRGHLAAGAGRQLLSLDGVALLRLDFATAMAQPLRSARLDAEQLPGLLGPGFDRLVLRPVEAREDDEGDLGRGIALTPLLWQTALRMRMVPRLIEPLTEDTALRLSQWPDFRVLAHRHDDFRLCSLLLKQACTATGAATLLDIEAGAARALFNAAYLSGYAAPAAAGDGAAPVQDNARAPARLARIWQGLRGGDRRRKVEDA